MSCIVKCVFSGIDFRSLWTYNNEAEGFDWLTLAQITAHFVVSIVSGCFFFKGFERVEQRSCCEQHASAMVSKSGMGLTSFLHLSGDGSWCHPLPRRFFKRSYNVT